jgi:hypothetical protein
MTIKLIIGGEVVREQLITEQILRSPYKIKATITRIKSLYMHELNRTEWKIIIDGVPSKGNEIGRYHPAAYTNTTPFKIANQPV